MKLPGGNPRPREGVNASESSGLGEFFILAIGLTTAAVVLAAGLALAAGWLAPLVPFRWEQTVAEGFSVESSTQHPQAVTELQEIADKLAPHEHLPKGMTVHVHLIDGKQPNAFATLGGQIFVTQGLLGKVSSENALAMVLGHEIAHIKHRDPIRSLSSGAVFQLIWAGLLGANGHGAARILGSAGLLTRLKFTRDMESAADREALTALRRTYGSDCGVGEFFRKVQRQQELPVWGVFLSSHPLTRDRLDEIEMGNADHRAVELRPLPPAIADLADAPEHLPPGCAHTPASTASP